jgi:inorganic pyrophosphatase
VLLLMDEPTFPGCLVRARLVGVIEAEQTEPGKSEAQVVRNDRVLAVAGWSHTFKDVHALDDLSEDLVAGVEHFFVAYAEMEQKHFRPLGRHGPDRALALVRQAQQNAQPNKAAGKKRGKGKKG